MTSSRANSDNKTLGIFERSAAHSSTALPARRLPSSGNATPRPSTLEAETTLGNFFRQLNPHAPEFVATQPPSRIEVLAARFAPAATTPADAKTHPIVAHTPRHKTHDGSNASANQRQQPRSTNARTGAHAGPPGSAPL